MRRATAIVAVAAVAAAYCGWVATTTPFTEEADIAVSLGFAAMVGGAGWARRRARPAAVALEPAPATAAPWLVVVGTVVVVELAAYFAGGADRAAFPTLSALSDLADRSTAVKAVLVAGWLLLGWGLLGR